MSGSKKAVGRDVRLRDVYDRVVRDVIA